MEELKVLIIDVSTGESHERLLTSEEISDREVMQTNQKTLQDELEAKQSAKISGMNKLIALGLTEEEAGALING
jgi:hypothetical protein